MITHKFIFILGHYAICDLSLFSQYKLIIIGKTYGVVQI